MFPARISRERRLLLGSGFIDVHDILAVIIDLSERDPLSGTDEERQRRVEAAFSTGALFERYCGPQMLIMPEPLLDYHEACRRITIPLHTDIQWQHGKYVKLVIDRNRKGALPYPTTVCGANLNVVRTAGGMQLGACINLVDRTQGFGNATSMKCASVGQRLRSSSGPPRVVTRTFWRSQRLLQCMNGAISWEYHSRMVGT